MDKRKIEQIRQQYDRIIHNDEDIEFWYARELMLLLGYERWENFDKAICRAMESKYDDKFIDSEDSYKHSKWLSFISERLFITKTLLSKNGAIFISIDDNEYAGLKLLCDSIFGEINYMGTIIQNKLNAKNDTVNIQKNHEYILAYRKQAIYISGTKIKPTLVNKEERFRPAFEEKSLREPPKLRICYFPQLGGSLNKNIF